MYLRDRVCKGEVCMHFRPSIPSALSKWHIIDIICLLAMLFFGVPVLALLVPDQVPWRGPITCMA